MQISAKEKKEETKEGLAWGKGVSVEDWEGGVAAILNTGDRIGHTWEEIFKHLSFPNFGLNSY